MEHIDEKIYERLVLESKVGTLLGDLSQDDLTILDTSFLGEMIRFIKGEGQVL